MNSTPRVRKRVNTTYIIYNHNVNVLYYTVHGIFISTTRGPFLYNVLGGGG